MTAYGRSTIVTPLGKLLIEFQSVNRKHLEIQCNLPPALLRFDSKIRSFLSQHINRGQIQLRVSLTPNEAEAPSLKINVPLLRQLIQGWKLIAQEAGHSESQPIPLEIFASQPQLLCTESEVLDEEKIWLLFQEGIEKAWKQALEYRLKEGKALQEDLLVRCKLIKKLCSEVELKARQIPDKYRERLKERLESVLSGSVEADERIMREVFLYAEKVDITEECVRLKVHLDKLELLLTTDQPCVGKELEFLLQEIGREVNTSGSKSPDIEVINLILAMKNEIERIREQVQNIE